MQIQKKASALIYVEPVMPNSGIATESPEIGNPLALSETELFRPSSEVVLDDLSSKTPGFSPSANPTTKDFDYTEYYRPQSLPSHWGAPWKVFVEVLEPEAVGLPDPVSIAEVRLPGMRDSSSNLRKLRKYVSL